MQTLNQTLHTHAEASLALAKLQRGPFIGKDQAQAVRGLFRCEERQFFYDKICELAALVETMPKTYEQEGKGDQAIVSLHYFTGGCDWHITERDMEPEQHQAFGLANIGYGAELGYISLVEILGAGAELDFHWQPKTLAELQCKHCSPTAKTEEEIAFEQTPEQSAAQKVWGEA